MFLVGLTGGIATGKSSVSKIFKELAVEVIDADVVARQVVKPGKPAWRKIRSEFGSGVMKATGEIDRAKLADVIFNDAARKRQLDAITRPEVCKQIFWAVLACFLKGHQFVILDLPLLFESGIMLGYMHKVIVVTCNADQQLDRLMRRNALPEAEAWKRIRAQLPLDEKSKRAHFVIDNSGSPEQTAQQVRRALETLRRSKRHWKLRFLVAGWLLAVATAGVWLVRYFGDR